MFTTLFKQVGARHHPETVPGMNRMNRLRRVVSPPHPRVPSPQVAVRSARRPLTFPPMHLDQWHLWEAIHRETSPSDRPSATGLETGHSPSSDPISKPLDGTPTRCSHSPLDESYTSFLDMKYPGLLVEPISRDFSEHNILASSGESRSYWDKENSPSYRAVRSLRLLNFVL